MQNIYNSIFILQHNNMFKTNMRLFAILCIISCTACTFPDYEFTEGVYYYSGESFIFYDDIVIEDIQILATQTTEEEYLLSNKENIIQNSVSEDYYNFQLLVKFEGYDFKNMNFEVNKVSTITDLYCIIAKITVDELNLDVSIKLELKFFNTYNYALQIQTPDETDYYLNNLEFSFADLYNYTDHDKDGHICSNVFTGESIYESHYFIAVNGELYCPLCGATYDISYFTSNSLTINNFVIPKRFTCNL